MTRATMTEIDQEMADVRWEQVWDRTALGRSLRRAERQAEAIQRSWRRAASNEADRRVGRLYRSAARLAV